MPALTTMRRSVRHPTITKFTNGRILIDNELVEKDLWVSSETGKIVRSQEAFYEHHVIPDTVVDLKGRILSPGLIDVQLNGAFGLNFSILPEDGDMVAYGKDLQRVNRLLLKTGLTSYVPTLTSQKSQVYQEALPYLGPSGSSRLADIGCESLGAHCEGPFLSPTKNGIHNPSVLISAPDGFASFEACYGATNLMWTKNPTGSGSPKPPNVKMITAAPEVPGIMDAIPSVASRDIVFSVGHSEATYEEAGAAVEAGATMVTHMFNAMRPLHHRNPGIFGLLGKADGMKRPYFGIIADGIHLHPASVKIAFNAYPEGFILVTDAMHLVGLPDGVYEWTVGDRLIKQGSFLTLEREPGKIAGSTVTLLDCVNNFHNWSGCSISDALRAVTATPAAMLGLQGVKGTLAEDADADLVILDENHNTDGTTKLVVDQVWKFGERVFDREAEEGLVVSKRST